MVRKGFKMKLYPDMAEEYEKRHNELWPEMKDMIHEYGGRNYTIFLDRETNVLYGYIEVEDLKNGTRAQIQQSIANGGILWLISWRRTRTIARCVQISMKSSI